MKTKNSVLQAIRTKYHGPTNHRGARITATAGGGCKLTLPYPYELSGEACHRQAAEALAAKLDWMDGYELSAGGLSDGYVYVLIPTGK